MARTGSTITIAILVILVLYTLTAFLPGEPWDNLDVEYGSLEAPAKSEPQEDPIQLLPENAARRLRFPEQFKTFHVPSKMVYSKDGPRPDQIVMLMASDGQGHNTLIPNLFERVKENRKQYAKLHGYHFHFINTTKYDLGEANPVWAKLPAIVETFNRFPKSQWIWWLDCDAIIMTPQIDLNSHLVSPKAMRSWIEKKMPIIYSNGAQTEKYTNPSPDVSQIDIIVSQDYLGLNAGSFFIRRSATAKWIVDMWADPMFINSGHVFQEQEALLKMVINHESVRAHVGYVPQRMINAYAFGDEKMKWSPGDFVVHFAGCWIGNKCEERFEDLWSKRKTVQDRRR